MSPEQARKPKGPAADPFTGAAARLKQQHAQDRKVLHQQIQRLESLVEEAKRRRLI